MTRLEKMRIKSQTPVALPVIADEPSTDREPDVEILPSQSVNRTCVTYTVRKLAKASLLLALSPVPVLVAIIYLTR